MNIKDKTIDRLLMKLINEMLYYNVRAFRMIFLNIILIIIAFEGDLFGI